MTVKQYLDSKGIYYELVHRINSGEQAIMECPSCGHASKFSINTLTGMYSCLRANDCGISGNFHQFQRLMGDEPTGRPSPSFIGEAKKNYVRPDISAYREAEGSWATWLTETRKIPAEIVKRFRCIISDKGELGFVYRNTDDEAVNVKYRTRDKHFRQETNAEPSLYGKNLVPPTQKELVICEGEMDAMAWAAYGYHAVSIPSGVKDTRWIENDWDWLERFSTVYLSFDMDNAGQGQVQAVARRLGLWRVKSISLPHKDANECLINGVTGFQIGDAIITAFEFSIPEIESPAAYQEIMLQLLRDPTFADGYKTNFKQFDKLLRGWRMGEVTVWTGKNGTGKTTFINQVIMANMLRHNLKVGVCSLEMLPFRLLMWMMMQSGAPMTETALKQFLQAHEGILYIVDKQGEITAEELLEIMAFGTKKYGIKIWVVDSLMRIAMYGQNELQQQRQFMNMLTSFAREHDCHVHLVAHPRKSPAHMKDLIIDKDDVGGSGVITDLAHNVMILHRANDELREAIKKQNGLMNVDLVVKVAKNRQHGTLGNCYFRYVHDAKIYAEAL